MVCFEATIGALNGRGIDVEPRDINLLLEPLNLESNIRARPSSFPAANWSTDSMVASICIFLGMHKEYHSIS